MTRRRGPVAGVLLVLAFLAPVRAADADRDDAASHVEPSAAATPPSTQPIIVPYPVDHDAPLDAVEKLVADEKGHTQFRVEFNGIKKGSRVPAYLYLPRRSQFKAPYPAIMLQYGTGGNKKTNYIVEIGERLLREGFVGLTNGIPNRGERRLVARSLP